MTANSFRADLLFTEHTGTEAYMPTYSLITFHLRLKWILASMPIQKSCMEVLHTQYQEHRPTAIRLTRGA